MKLEDAIIIRDGELAGIRKNVSVLLDYGRETGGVNKTASLLCPPIRASPQQSRDGKMCRSQQLAKAEQFPFSALYISLTVGPPKCFFRVAH